MEEEESEEKEVPYNADESDRIKRGGVICIMWIN